MSRPLIVMGPSGCGKTTLGRSLAEALQRRFVEGDQLHPPANRERMSRGEALSDADRIPFLDAVAAALIENPAAVASCSALKRAYRDRLRRHLPNLVFVLPVVEFGELARRMSARPGHFMPVSLLNDQLAALELLMKDEAGLVIDGSSSPSEQVAHVLERLASLP